MDPSSIPPREWLFSKHYIRKFVSATVAPGGLGKTSNSMVEALSFATGRPLLGETVAKPGRVWLWNGEDPEEELLRRMMAICKHYGISRADVDGRVFLDSGRKQRMIIAREDRSGLVVAEPVVEQVMQAIRVNEIDIMIVDPFVASHELSENDNNRMNAVARQWARIADECRCSIELVHHARKLHGNEMTVEDARGGSALMDAARSGRTLNLMTPEEGRKAGVDNHRLYFRLGDGKTNMQPPADRATWRKLVSVPLGNVRADSPGDWVGVVAPWEWPAQLEGVPADAEIRIIKAMTGVFGRASDQAEDWIGKIIAKTLDFDISNDRQRAQVRTIIADYTSRGIFEEFEEKDANRKSRPYIRLKPAAPPGSF
jgi:hypothetical protein